MQKRNKILSKIEDNNGNISVGADDSVRPQLTKIGAIVENIIKETEQIYDNVKIDQYIIMPNHVHMIININEGGQSRPPLHKIIQGIKSFSTKKYWENINKSKLWQRNYYEHIIRNEKEYWEIYEYIEKNPMKWKYDEYNK